VKAADQALKGSAFDEEGCEQGGLDHFGAHILSLVNQGGCAPCTGPMSSVAAVGTTGFADTINGNIYCAPGVPFGGDDGGNVPPDKATGKCEDQLAHRATSARGRPNHPRPSRAPLSDLSRTNTRSQGDLREFANLIPNRPRLPKLEPGTPAATLTNGRFLSRTTHLARVSDPHCRRHDPYPSPPHPPLKNTLNCAVLKVRRRPGRYCSILCLALET
jgi:hypothetical protein